MISEDEGRKQRKDLKRKIIARMTKRLPMWEQWSSILMAALLWGGGIAGLSVLIFWLMKALRISWVQNVQTLFISGICFGVIFVLMVLPYLLVPGLRDLRIGLAFARLGQRCLQLDNYEATLHNLERAEHLLAIQARNDPAVKRSSGTIYSGLGLAHCALGHYEKSLTYYLLAQQTFLDQDARDSVFLEAALVQARMPSMQEQANLNLTTLIQRTKRERSGMAIQCLTALAALCITRGDMENLVSYRRLAIKYYQEHPQSELVTQFIALLSLLSSSAGDFHGAVEAAALALQFSERMDIVRRIVELPAIGSIPDSHGFLVSHEIERTEQVITRAAAMLSKSNALWLGEDYDQAIDLVWDVARDIREWRGAALMGHKLQKWETAAIACLGRNVISQNETGPLWQRYYAIGWRPFAFLDDPAIDDLDFHDYVGYGLYSLLKLDDALSHEITLLDEARQQSDYSKQVAHLRHISAIYQAAHNWLLAGQYQSQALEIARSRLTQMSYLTCLLRQIVLALADSQAAVERDDLVPMFNEAHTLLSDMDKDCYRSWGLIKLGGLYFALGKCDNAIKCYQEAIQTAKMVRLLSIEIDAHLQLGTIYEECKQWENALAIYTNAQALAKRYLFVSIQTLTSSAGRAHCLWRLHRFKDALQECQSYLQLNAHISTDLVKQFHSIEFRPIEKSTVNDLMVQLLFEDSRDNIRAFEQVEYAKTEKVFSFDKLMTFLRQQAMPITVAEYYTTKDYTMLFVIDAAHHGISAYRVPVSSQRIRDCMDLLVEEVHSYQQWGAELESTWQELAQPLIEPLISCLNDQGILYVIPHGLLHYIPFHAIRYEGHYLIERCPIAYARSGAVIMQSQEHPRTWMRATVVGNPSRDLRGASNEVREVAKLFNVVPRVGHDAKFGLHREHIDTDILHVATHGLFDPNQPTLSGILLADELLTIPKILEMQVQANLVTLSGCETGLSKIVPGKQLVGLTSAFLEIGVPSVIVSLWKADDTATTDLMISFYRQLRSGARSLAHALRSAQLDTQRSSSWHHPYFWAPFVLVGSWH